MRLKTHFKKGLDIAPNLAVNIDDAPAYAAADAGTEQMLHHVENEDTDASAAFQRQIDALRRAEAHAPVLPPDQEYKAAVADLEKAYEAGDLVAQNRATNRISKANVLMAQEQDRAAPALHQLSERQQRFVLEHPHMLANANTQSILHGAIIHAHQQGHEPDSEAFHQAVKDNYDKVYSHESPHIKSKPPPDLEPDPDIKRGRIVSAPVSREGPVGGTRASDYDGSSPSRITLSAQEKSMARSLALQLLF